jgi:hypothetical protein
MLVSELIEKAAVKAGLAEPGAVPASVAAMGLSDFNRWYRYVWQRHPHRDLRLADVTLAVPAGDGIVALPTAVDVIRVVRDGNGALLPLGDATAADFATVFLGVSGVPSRYITLPDGTDADAKPVRRIQLVPAPAAALTLTVNGLRRYAALAAGDTVLLSRCEDALYFYVLGELYRFEGDSASRKEAFADAETHLANALTFEDQSPESDPVSLPVDSFYG